MLAVKPGAFLNRVLCVHSSEQTSLVGRNHLTDVFWGDFRPLHVSHSQAWLASQGMRTLERSCLCRGVWGPMSASPSRGQESRFTVLPHCHRNRCMTSSHRPLSGSSKLHDDFWKLPKGKQAALTSSRGECPGAHTARVPLVLAATPAVPGPAPGRGAP